MVGVPFLAQCALRVSEGCADLNNRMMGGVAQKEASIRLTGEN